MGFEHYVFSGTRRLRCGYTTGSCAALASKAATLMLLGGDEVGTVSIMTPKGLPVTVDVLDIVQNEYEVSCAVRKDGGDDIDATDGMLIYATVHRIRPNGGRRVLIDGGEGIGRITQAGLDQEIGDAAINHVPRQMISDAVRDACDESAYDGGISVIISAPEGMKVARKTFNARLGIIGGISILGTTGIVEPQSLQALLDTVEAEVKVRAAQSDQLIITPGSYGEAFLDTYELPVGIPEVKCSNFIGATLDFCAISGFREVLLVSHIGKLVKVAGGIMNTHSRTADCRCEIFCAHAAMAGADRETARALMSAATADACLDILDEVGLRGSVLESLSRAIQDRLEYRVAGAYRVGAVAFSNKHGFLFATDEGNRMIDEWRGQ